MAALGIVRAAGTAKARSGDLWMKPLHTVWASGLEENVVLVP